MNRKRCGRKRGCPCLSNTRNFAGGTRKTKIEFQCSLCLGQVSKWLAPEFKLEALSLYPREFYTQEPVLFAAYFMLVPCLHAPQP
jgi:hypothetical protein